MSEGRGSKRLPWLLRAAHFLPAPDVCCLMCTCTGARDRLAREGVWLALLKRDCGCLQSAVEGSARARYTSMWRAAAALRSSPERSNMRHFGEPVPDGDGVKQLRMRVGILGDAGIGKGALVERLCHDTFPEAGRRILCRIDFSRVVVKADAVAAELGMARLAHEPDMDRKLEMWETSSLGRHWLYTVPPLWKGAVGIVCVCYSVHDRASFDAARTAWLPFTRQSLVPDVIVALVALQCEGDEAHWAVPRVEAQAVAWQARNRVGDSAIYAETSSRDSPASLHRLAARLVAAAEVVRLRRIGHIAPRAQQHAVLQELTLHDGRLGMDLPVADVGFPPDRHRLVSRPATNGDSGMMRDALATLGAALLAPVQWVGGLFGARGGAGGPVSDVGDNNVESFG